MNVSTTARLITILSAFMLLVSCSDQFSNENEEEQFDLSSPNFSKGSKKSKHSNTLELINHYSFNDADYLAFDEMGNYDLLEVTASFDEDGVDGGALSVEEGTYALTSVSKKRRGHFHSKFRAKSHSVWFKASEPDGEHFILEEGGRINSMGLQIKDGVLRAAVTTKGQRRRVMIETPLTDTESFHHAAVVFDHGSFSLYLDGELIATEKTKFRKVKNHPNGGAIGARYGRSVFNDKKFPYKKHCKKHKKRGKKHSRKCKNAKKIKISTYFWS